MSPNTSIIGFVGLSGAGKTSIIKHVIKLLSERGFSVCYIKSGAHRVDIDKPGKDTFVAKEAGAFSTAIIGQDVTVEFPEQTWFANPLGLDHEALPGDWKEISPQNSYYTEFLCLRNLWNLRHLFHSADLVIIEGMKSAPWPKILVNNFANPKGQLPKTSLSNVVHEVTLSSGKVDWNKQAGAIVETIFTKLFPHRLAGMLTPQGFVLAGGKSKRFGRDKVLTPLNFFEKSEPPLSSWLERAVVTLGYHCKKVWVLGRNVHAGDQYLEGLRTPVLSHLDIYSGLGPLGAFASALEISFPDPAVIIPGDLPLLSCRTLDLLMQHRDDNHQAFSFIHADGLREPAVILLNNSAKPEIKKAVESNKLALHGFLDSIKTKWIPITSELRHEFFNVNTIDDLTALEQLIRKGAIS